MTEFSIYQINVDRDTANVCFIGMESLEKIKGTKEVNAAAYDRVYDGKMDCISLENIYQKFNVDHPADYKGRSLSVSDVVEIRDTCSAPQAGRKSFCCLLLPAPCRAICRKKST